MSREKKEGRDGDVRMTLFLSTLSLMIATFISVDERLFPPSLIDALESVDHYYVGQVQVEVHTEVQKLFRRHLKTLER